MSYSPQLRALDADPAQLVSGSESTRLHLTNHWSSSTCKSHPRQHRLGQTGRIESGYGCIFESLWWSLIGLIDASSLAGREDG